MKKNKILEHKACHLVTRMDSFDPVYLRTSMDCVYHYPVHPITTVPVSRVHHVSTQYSIWSVCHQYLEHLNLLVPCFIRNFCPTMSRVVVKTTSSYNTRLVTQSQGWIPSILCICEHPCTMYCVYHDRVHPITTVIVSPIHASKKILKFVCMSSVSRPSKSSRTAFHAQLL